jgi:anti-anti-sigma regulatory factor
MCEGELYVTRSEPRSGVACPFCRGPLWFLKKEAGEVVVLTFLSDGKYKNSPPAWNDATFWSIKNATRVVVDLSRLLAVSIAFLDTIVTIQQRLKTAGGVLKVCGVRPNVIEAFEDAELDAIVEIYSDEETALESFEQPADVDSMIFPMVGAAGMPEVGEMAIQA